MMSSVLKQVVLAGWEFPEEAAVLCLSFTASCKKKVELLNWLERLVPEVSMCRRRAALKAVQRLFEKGYGATLVTWVLEDRVPRWSRRCRQHVLQVLTDWAVVCGAPSAQIRVLLLLEQIGQRRRVVGRYGDRPPR